MTELPHHRDDEIVSAVLDGEATADERARVESVPELQRRLSEIRQVRDAVATPVDRLDELSARRLVDRALTAATSGGDAAPTSGRSGRISRRRQRDGTLIGLGSAAAVVILALLVGPAVLSSLGDDDDADFATVAGEADDSGPEALSDGGPEMEGYDAADDGDWAEGADPSAGAIEDWRWPQGLVGAERVWLGSHDSFESLLAELEQVVGPRLEAATASARSGYGGAVPECPEPGDGALIGPFTAFDTMVDGRVLVVVVAGEDSGERAFTILDPATCELVDPS